MSRLSSGAVRPPAALLGIGPEAAPAWLALCVALDRLAETGRTPVCGSEPEQWGPDAGAAARRDAAEACNYCPALHPCAAFADVADERFGVWGGTDRALRPRPRAAKETTTTDAPLPTGDHDTPPKGNDHR